jgi:hypothetical protein
MSRCPCVLDSPVDAGNSSTKKADYIQVANLMNPDRYYAVNFLNRYYRWPGTVGFRMGGKWESRIKFIVFLGLA